MIILSSYGLRSPIIAQKARELINPANMSVLVIPFAGFNNENTAAREINEGLIPFGFNIDNIFVCSIENPELYKDKKFDLIYVPGGNPFKLLKEAKECNLLPWVIKLVNEGATYFGVSSGADFACENIEYLRLAEDCDYTMEDYNCLGLIKEKVLCHVDQRDMATLQRVKDFDDKKAIFLRNDEIYTISESEEQ